MSSQELIFILDSIINEVNHRIGEPWKRKDILGLLIPILQNTTKKRSYKTLQELRERQIKLEDTGDISGVKITVESDTPVFLRAGSIFEGIDTQTRTLETSILISPSKTLVVPVKCVEASHPISRTAAFKVSKRTAPLKVERALRTGDQGSVWKSVNSERMHSMNYLSRISDRFRGGGVGEAALASMANIDNLAKIVKMTDDFAKDLDQFMREIPVFENQVGLAVLDDKGVVGVEIFDSPESWNAISEDIIKKYGQDILTKKPSKLFKITVKVQEAKKNLIEFLGNLKELKRPVETINFKDGKTKIFQEKKTIMEYTTLKNDIIHLTAIREEL